MRDIIIIIILIAIIFGGGIFAKKYVDNSSNKISRELIELNQNTIIARDTGNTSQIIKQINELEKDWEEVSNIWSIIVIHQEIDNVEGAIIKAKACIENGELEDAIQEIELANFFVNHVKEREEVSLKNIF